MCSVISRDELVDEILTPLYNLHSGNGERLQGEPSNEGISAHKIALLFLVLALGALVDLTIPADSEESERYYDLGRAALSVYSVFTSSETVTVQGLLLMGLNHLQGGRRYSTEAGWAFITLASKRAQSVSLRLLGTLFCSSSANAL